MLEYVHRIAEKVANEPLEDELRNWIIGETEDGHMPLVKKKRKQTKEEMYMPDSEEILYRRVLYWTQTIDFCKWLCGFQYLD